MKHSEEYERFTNLVDHLIRVPREEAAQVVDILKKEGRTVDAVYYPQEGHGFMKREDQIDEITGMVGWFDKYLRARIRN